MRVSVHPEVEVDAIVRGQEVALNESLNVVLARSAEISGEVVILKELLESKDRALIVGRADEERVCELAAALMGEKLRAGDHLLMDGRSGLLVERIPRPEVEELVLEEVPDVTYDDVGGLDDQIDAIKGIGSIIGEVNEVATAIAAAVQQQGAATQEITRSTQFAAQGTKNVSENISGVKADADAAAAAAEDVKQASQTLETQSQQLGNQVTQFLGKIRAA